MSLLLEQPACAITFGVLAAVGCGGAWAGTGRLCWLVVSLAVIVGTSALVALERWVETDREQVDSTLRMVVDAVARNDASGVLRHIHPLATELRVIARQQMRQVEFGRIEIKPNLAIQVERSSRVATADFNVFVVLQNRRGRERHAFARYVQVWFRREGGDWLIERYAHSHFIDGVRDRRSPEPG